jgi:dTDP-glucose pyrophosphorylase
MMKSPTLVVLAAGMGSRYGSLKQMDAFGPFGENIIDYSIYDAILAGFSKVVFVIRAQFESAFKEFFTGKFEDRIDVEFVCQELDVLPKGFFPPTGREKPWGTGHAVWVTHGAVEGPFAVINADDFYGRDAYFKIRDYFNSEDASKGNYCVVGYYLHNTLSDHGTVNRGVCLVDEDLYLRGVREIVKIARDPDGVIRYPGGGVLDDDALVSMNIWGFLPSYFDYAEESLRSFLTDQAENPASELYIPSIVDQLISDGKLQVKVLPSNSTWFGVTYREDKPFVTEQIKKHIEDGVYPEALWK